MLKSMLNRKKDSMLNFPQCQKSMLMTRMLFSSVEWQKKSQKPLMLFRVSKMALIEKITILSATLLMKTTHGKLIAHLCHNRWCLLCDVERMGCYSSYKQKCCGSWRWRHCVLSLYNSLTHIFFKWSMPYTDVKYMKVSIFKSSVWKNKRQNLSLELLCIYSHSMMIRCPGLNNFYLFVSLFVCLF